jgi:putative DNA methylase
MAETAQQGGEPSLVHAGRSLLEGKFPFVEVSEVARRDRYSRDPVYAAHKWWARRPPAVIRALLIAASLPASTSPPEFWKRFVSREELLADFHVGDPFSGGATSLVEAARLGASVTGTDVDPLAVEIARHELDGVDQEEFALLARRLLDELRADLGHLYPQASKEHESLHSFWLRELSCPSCSHVSLIYRSLILARHAGLQGGVVRDAAIHAFCPQCRTIHALSSGRSQLRCCGRRWRLASGTYAAARFKCPGCASRFSNEELKVGSLPRVLIAVEDTARVGYRRIRAPVGPELRADAAAETLNSENEWRAPAIELTGAEGMRAAHYGLATVADLFSARQTAVFTRAFSWISNAPTTEQTRRALYLAVSNALTSNNVLCGYATDYGRLSPLFAGVRSFAVPILSVELNPLHASAGRGTLAKTLQRIGRDTGAEVERHSYDARNDAVVRASFVARRRRSRRVSCQSAERPFPDDLGMIDLAVTDPPYYDFIPYSDLSLVHRAWLGVHRDLSLRGAPIFPLGEDRRTEFAKRLGRAFRQTEKALKPGGLVVFTYHSAHEEAWSALEEALRQSLLRVSAVFPVWADARAAGHGHAGNCEWDLVFICRRSGEAGGRELPATIDEWGDIALSKPDRQNLRLGLDVAHKQRLR